MSQMVECQDHAPKDTQQVHSVGEASTMEAASEEG